MINRIMVLGVVSQNAAREARLVSTVLSVRKKNVMAQKT